MGFGIRASSKSRHPPNNKLFYDFPLIHVELEKYSPRYSRGYPAASGRGGVTRLSLGSRQLVNLSQVINRLEHPLIPHATICIYQSML